MTALMQRQSQIRTIIDEIIDRNADDVFAMDELLGFYEFGSNADKAMFHYEMVRRAVYERKLRHREAVSPCVRGNNG